MLAVYLHFQTVIIKGNHSFRYKFVLIQVISIRTQALKLLKKFNHFKYSLRLNKKNISGDLDTRRGERNSVIFLSPRRVSPLLVWGDFHARSRFARPTIPEEKWGTTRSLQEIILHSLSQVRETIYNSIEQICIKQIVPKRLCIATTVYLSSQQCLYSWSLWLVRLST